MPPVAVVLDHAQGSKAWDVERAVGYRTVVLRKLADELPPFDWEGERLGGRMTFRYLPPARPRRRIDPASRLQHAGGPRARRALPPWLGPEVAEDRLTVSVSERR